MEDFTQEELEICLKVLQTISRNPNIADDLVKLKTLVTKIYTKSRKERRSQTRQTKSQEVQRLKESTFLYRKNKALESSENTLPELAANSYRKSAKPINCYVCKEIYTEVHFFYHLLCPKCAEFNYAKRFQTANLTGRKALITGGRLKIGYQTALRMLRDGAEVIVTTRFPQNAVGKFAGERDFSEWQNRLKIFALDLRNIVSVERFAENLLQTEAFLDIIIHNAAQTIKRPIGFYRHLLDVENDSQNLLPHHLQSIIKSTNFQIAEKSENYPQMFVKENLLISKQDFDGHGQPKDYRSQNSWTSKLEEVSTLELLETQLVNVISPFIINGNLKELLIKSPHERKFIVNVSAMEGQFNRRNKTCFHPHTNMAKASLNMMTRTSAQDFAKDGIFMNSVDTGWITEENPHPKKTKIQDKGFVTPLDEIDGTARIYDPIAQGVNSSEEPVYGHFLKNYFPGEW
jgi:NAD(P)-dependent dehydrogenase (short-subunit alcohol dehydrogenase family)